MSRSRFLNGLFNTTLGGGEAERGRTHQNTNFISNIMFHLGNFIFVNSKYTGSQIFCKINLNVLQI